MSSPKNKHKNTKLYQIACHEAAHAITAHHFGDTPRSVTIIPHGETAGSSNDSYPLHRNLVLVNGVITFNSNDADGGIIELFAGHYAAVQAGMSFIESRKTCSADLDEIANFLRETKTSHATLRNRARRMVKQNWRAIEAVAKELLKYKCLDGDELEYIILMADGDTNAETYLAEYRARRK